VANDDGMWAVEQATVKTNETSQIFNIHRSLIFKKMSRLASIQIFLPNRKCMFHYDYKKARRISELKNKKEPQYLLEGKA